MSRSPAGDEIRDESAPIQPPPTPNPLAPLLPLVVPTLFAVLIACGLVWTWDMMNTAEKESQKLRKQAADVFSRSYQPSAPPPPTYVPGNNPNGPFTPRVP